MGRRKLSDKEKAGRKLASLLKVPLQDDVVQEAIEDIRSENYKPPAHWEIEAVLRSLEKPAAFTYKKCKRCGEMFGTNYRAVAYCSDHCRQVGFQNQTGIRWNPLRSTPEQRWGGEPPLIVSPDVLKKLLPWAEHLVSQSQKMEPQVEPEVVHRDDQKPSFDSPFDFDNL